MINLVSTLRCTRCGLHDVCHEPARAMPRMQEHLHSMRKACRGMRRELLLFAGVAVLIAPLFVMFMAR